MVFPAPTYGHPAPVTYKDETPKPYAFEYGVHDDYAGTNFAQNENADGSTASGSYSVLLPDGRTQTVTYHADQVKLYFIQLLHQFGHSVKNSRPEKLKPKKTQEKFPKKLKHIILKNSTAN